MKVKSRFAGLGIALGAALGAVFGVIAGNVGVWLAVGIAIGVAIGASWKRNAPPFIRLMKPSREGHHEIQPEHRS
jgi:predicted lysophospholipase L1 biosynthesis ABC-type transport system permease subunit